MAVAHDVVAVDRLRVGALVAGDDARRHVERPHDHHEGGGEVLAEALLAVEPELVDRMPAGVVAVGAGLQGVGIGAAADLVHHRLDQRLGVRIRIAGVASQRGGPGEGAWVVAGRQVDVLLQADDRVQRPVLEVQVRLRLQAQPLGDGALALPLQVVATVEAHALDAWQRLRRLDRHLQQRQDVVALWLERHLVAQHRAGHPQVGPRAQLRREARLDAAPLAAVEVRQHRPAQVQRGRRRRRPVEAQPQRDAVVQRQLRHRAHLHAVGQAGHRGGVLRHAPQRGRCAGTA